MSPSARRHNPSVPPSAGRSGLDDGGSWRGRGRDQGSHDAAERGGDGWRAETLPEARGEEEGEALTGEVLFFSQRKIPIKHFNSSCPVRRTNISKRPLLSSAGGRRCCSVLTCALRNSPELSGTLLICSNRPQNKSESF